MRLTARWLAVAYTALVGLVPVLHAGEEGYTATIAMESGHHSSCATGHDEATCPLQHLPRLTTTTTDRPLVASANGPVRSFAHRPFVRPQPSIVLGAPAARGPPAS